MRQKGPPFVVKRLVDVLASGTVLVVAAPLLAIVSVAILSTMGRPVFFRQQRVGRDERTFSIAKFRTMTAPTDDTTPETDEQRLTSVGRFLRSSSIDEFPQLWHVLVGDMSLVGPRPLLTRYLPRYNEQQRRRHEVMPGITGWAQIHGRNAVGWEEKFNKDVWYVDNWTPWLDIGILFRTALTLVRREGISADGHATMPEFLGAGEPTDEA